MNAALRRAIEQAVAADGNARWRDVGSTGWGHAWSLATGRACHFVKIVASAHADMLECEADGLRALGSTATVRVPAISAIGGAGASNYLALEWLDMTGPPKHAGLGRALAQLHRAPTPRGPNGERFGWHRDNWIGATPQANGWSDDWCAFFRDRRLAPQLALALENGFRTLQRDGERMLAAMPTLFEDWEPAPSLVHGDLWSGNAATLANGEAAVFDPAVYVADREVDLAMTELFGGFGGAFDDGYRSVSPPDEGYASRRDVYNLYHLLNHLNLFGEAYLARVTGALARIRLATG